MNVIELERDGAELAAATLTQLDLEVLTGLFAEFGERPGNRLSGHPAARFLVNASSTLSRIACEKLGARAIPVRLVLFDKTTRRNWGVAWHQDRTIAVADRREVDGFGPWSTKQGVTHVAPPFEVLAGMLTLRSHLDACDETNAPLIVAKGSHRIGAVAADLAAEIAATFEAATCLAETGQIWLYRTPILHTSKPARKPRRRRVLQVDFATTDLPGSLRWMGV